MIQSLKGVSGNYTFSISDHLPQFLLIPKEDNRHPRKHNIQKRDLKKYNKESLVADVLDIKWPEILAIEKMDTMYSFEMFDNKINEILDKHVPLKKLSKKELKLKAKPWITPEIIKSIQKRDKLLRLYIKMKESNRNEELYTEYKKVRNKTVAMIRNSKKLYYQKYFNENAKDIRRTWAGIKTIINIRTSSKGQPSSMLIDNQLETDPKNCRRF